ncbi:VOC family protein [Streptomyces sp. NPDC051940]|uniref:VOC family protein n=1 Tax=Streptomyces sp. NPDC051940 TaxID=3155675 RepID=UPI00343E10B5
MTLLAHNLPAAQDFYGTLFGWRFETGLQRVGPYTQDLRAQADGQDLAGIGELPPDSRQHPVWTPYFIVRDADVAAANVRSTGGTVAVGPLDLTTRGRMALCSDPTGAVFGIWQPREHLGWSRRPLPGTPVWNELWVPEPSMVSRFYEWIFGCTMDKQADGSLTLLAGGQAVAAIRPLPPSLATQTPPHWSTHFAVKDAAETVALLGSLGGRLLRGPYDVPGGVRAEVADPEGAEFTLVSDG